MDGAQCQRTPRGHHRGAVDNKAASMALPTSGFSAMAAAMGWIDEAMES